ncbi:hypothetical protein T484DRAFT_1960661 [Baffinella frigidus]|nr:hypothetical protein T484DRAFT_1960661 [Cryptophyta sp. CCMP2293]
MAAPKVAKVVAVCAAMCLMTLAVYHGTTAGPVEMFAQQGTPDLKTLLGKFMQEQGAKPSDIKEMQEYYAGDKAPEQMLDDISGEFDPINDYDSNYGRVLGVEEPSRTNGVVPEDMDASPERKAPVQMLYDVDGPQPSDGAAASWAASGVLDQGRDEATTDSLGSSAYGKMPADKAPVQMLFDVDGPQPTDPSKAFLARSAMGSKARREKRDGNKKYRSAAETAGFGYESTLAAANTQKLDDISGEFDPINDYDSNYGRVLGVEEPSRTNGVVPEDMDASPERKAPVQMLYDVDGPQPSDGAAASWAASGVLDQGRDEATTASLGSSAYGKMPADKAPVQMLDDISGEFDPINDYDSNYGRVLGVEEPSRTNGVVPEDMDASPERKAPVQMLYDVDGPQPSDGAAASWAASGVLDQGRNEATTDSLGSSAYGKMPADKAPEQMLFDVDGPQPSDGAAASWAASGVPDQGRNSVKTESLGDKIRAGWPKAPQ